MAPEKHPIVAERYKLVRELGDGTFGQVLLGQRLDNGEKVAVKRCVSIWSVLTNIRGMEKPLRGKPSEKLGG